jgi:DNA repair photolyase
VPLISRFDPRKSRLCTCNAKLTFNPYTGCDHHCLYCYASTYIPNHRDIRIKKDLLPNLRRELTRAHGQTLTMSSSSDPYPTIETKLALTRKCLELIAQSQCRLQIYTKSNLITRDIDLLRQIPCTIAITITTQDDQLASALEPGAPSSTKRLKAIKVLVEAGLPVIARVDPIIPFINDSPTVLVGLLSDLGVKHITSSTYKVKADNWRRLQEAMPKIAQKLYPLYFKQGEIIAGSRLLPKELRFKLMKNIRDLADAKNIRFSVCREGFNELNTAQCDGSWLMPKQTEAPQCRIA